MKPILVSGIKPSGRLHLGNYVGALKHFVELQNSGAYECYFFIADLHSLTESFDPREKMAQVKDLMTDFLAAGLTPERATLFVQSQISAHTELAWILSTVTPFGDLRRMTQFKDKAERAGAEANVGLFTYPVLMAADILLYSPVAVPVGDDQRQHLELARTLARKFNTRFGETFTEPKPLMTTIPRLMSLSDVARKMSKTEPKGCIFLDDSPGDITEKVMAAVTDSGKEIVYDEKKKPAVANLLQLMSALTNTPYATIEKQFEGKGYRDFKAALAETIIESLAPFRTEKKKLSEKQKTVQHAFAVGTDSAREIANKKLSEAQQKVGIISH